MHSLEKDFHDSELCIVANGYLQDEKSLALPVSQRPRSYALFYCGEGYDYKTINGLKKFSPIYPASQAESDHPKPIYVVEKDGQFQTTQGYPVIYIGRVLDSINDQESRVNFNDVRKLFLEKFNNNEDVYSVFFERILIPSIGSGIPTSEMKHAQRAFASIQAELARKENREKAQKDIGPTL